VPIASGCHFLYGLAQTTQQIEIPVAMVAGLGFFVLILDLLPVRPQLVGRITIRRYESPRWRVTPYAFRLRSSSYGGQVGSNPPYGLRAQNIPFALARGMFGAIIGAEFFGSPTICNVSQCSIALPSASIL
jgi:hypothetical protein